MLKSLRTTFALLVLTGAIAASAHAQESAKPQESPWAMRAPAAVPQGAPTISAAQRAAMLAAEKGTPEQQEFARKMADAMVSKDYAALKLLIAPSALKCIGKHDDFLQDRMKRQFALPMSRKFKLKMSKLPAKVINETKYATYPMLPTYLMGMEFTTPDGSNATVNLTIGQEDGKWYESQPCPTDAGMERFAKLQHMRTVQREHAQAVVVQVKDPLKSQLLAMVSKHNTAGAWQLCMSQTHYDFPTCRGVVAILSGDEGY
jgi:hypothetical protein